MTPSTSTQGVLMMTSSSAPERSGYDRDPGAHVTADRTHDDAVLDDEVKALRATVAQLQHALDSRVIIEQGKGVLAERLGVSPDAAFEVMRTYARSNRLSLHEVAADVVAGTLRL